MCHIVHKCGLAAASDQRNDTGLPVRMRKKGEGGVCTDAFHASGTEEIAFGNGKILVSLHGLPDMEGGRRHREGTGLCVQILKLSGGYFEKGCVLQILKDYFLAAPVSGQL
jgi:hypothetical protein